MKQKKNVKVVVFNVKKRIYIFGIILRFGGELELKYRK